jgi:hypothetical protein
MIYLWNNNQCLIFNCITHEYSTEIKLMSLTCFGYMEIILREQVTTF